MYKCICGSRSYNLNLPASDYDMIIICDNADNEHDIVNSHAIWKEADQFIKDLLLINVEAGYLQYYFPSIILLETEVTNYLIQHREDIIRANLDRVYTAYITKAKSLSRKLDTWGMQYPKRIVYSCLFYDTLYRYATHNISFEEAFKPEEDFRQWLLSVRKGEIAKEEIIRKNEELRIKAESVSAFYIGVENKDYLNQVISDLNQMLNTNVEFM